MRAGDLRYRVNILRPMITGRTSVGEVALSWTTVATGVWAGMQDLNEDDKFAAQRYYTDVSAKFLFRYSTLIDEKYRLLCLDDGRVYDIISVIDIDGRRRSLDVLAKYISTATLEALVVTTGAPLLDEAGIKIVDESGSTLLTEG